MQVPPCLTLLCACVHLASHFISRNYEKKLEYKLQAVYELRIRMKLSEPFKNVGYKKIKLNLAGGCISWVHHSGKSFGQIYLEL